MRIAVACAVVAMLANRAKAETRPTITTTLDFAIGSVDVGAIDGFTAPGGHFDVGVGLGNLRLQAELDRGLWTDESLSDSNAKTPETPVVANGSFSRVGLGLRWYWMNLPYTHATDTTRIGRLRVYLETGIGNEQVTAPSATVARPDVEIGLGMAQESPVGKVVLGGHIGLRVLVAEPPGSSTSSSPRTICSGSCPSRSVHADVAMFVVFGLVFGR